mmetsp:Transcript_49243/g.44075  ORF Transcript_49243/g.44075 Transcript_49243/m.44075 type:complete len:182 (-) Transcript_49243:155-700(-)|eukprot:CAMPEP_0201586430 /NCGR_PEP_ID=MMETSP0190_2-20130828/132879_1 /ASSEMBLY_ACC=CAM_ASM_000263 /TAXON_ID=37353 /ORGANISM="Rosalina sp." /LENGTH=181 /DNA_ID=CAMNT_0048034457 /DNA_START=28 /DNA_END=576 /DNA_ORIENTATION=-
MGTKKGAGSTKGNIAGGLAILAAILVIIALIVNSLIYYSVEILGVTTSTSIGWNRSKTCNSLLDQCVEIEYSDLCDLCIDGESCDACTYQNAAITWLAFNIIGAIAFVVAAGVVFMGKGGALGKGGAGIGALAIIIALFVYYIVADDVGIWNSDEDNINMGASGYLDVVAAVAGIVAAVMA